MTASPNSPAISIVIPTYNQPGLLLETLASVFCQTFTDFEVIVVNDGSTDDTLDRLRSLVGRHADRLRVITQPNAGTGAARNRGLDEARGKHVALLDHDDLWMPGKLGAQVQYLESHPARAACVVPYALSTDPSKPVFDRSALADDDGVVARPFRKLADKQALLMTCSVMAFPRDKARGLQFGTERGAIEDVPFQIGLLARGTLGVAGAGDEILAIYRTHAGNTSAQASYYYRGIKLLRRMDREGRFAGLSATDRADMLAWLGFMGRAACVSQLLHGRRLRGLEIYLREFPRQLRQRRFDVLLAFPALALAPAFVVQRWSRRGAPRTSGMAVPDGEPDGVAPDPPPAARL